MSSNQTQFQTGAVRSTDANNTRYDLLSPIALRRYAEAMAEGSEKYGDFNWEKGMPVHDILNHCLRHIFMYLSGDRSEDHLGHAMWNIASACHSDELWVELNKGHLRTEGCGLPETMRDALGAAINTIQNHIAPTTIHETDITREQVQELLNPSPRTTYRSTSHSFPEEFTAQDPEGSEFIVDDENDPRYRELPLDPLKDPINSSWDYRLRTDDHHAGWEIYEVTTGFIAGHTFEKLHAIKAAQLLSDQNIPPIHSRAELMKNHNGLRGVVQLNITKAEG